MLLLEHLRLGDVPDNQVKGCDGGDEGEDGAGDSQRHPHLHGARKVLFHVVHGARQHLPDAVSGVAERADGQVDAAVGAVAVDPLRVRRRAGPDQRRRGLHRSVR